MASQLYQVIEGLSRDKGIDPGIVVAAVEDAIALATRKYYKTQENMRAELDKDTGEIRAYVYKTVTATDDEIEDDLNQIALEEAKELAPDVEVGGEIRYYKPTDCAGTYRRADGEAGDLPEGARGRARHRLQRICASRRRK